jgi:hypothetical protein
MVVITAALSGYGHLTLVDSMMLLAVLVIVPAAVPVHPHADHRIAWIAVLSGLPVATALLIDRGPAAAAMVAPWLAVSGIGALLSLIWWLRSDHRLRDLLWPAAWAYLVVGAAWLAADRLDLTPFGYSEPFVQLTAVHFHYAGFASVTLVGAAWCWLPRSHSAAIAAILTVVASPIIAMGFTFAAVLQIVGAVLLTVGLWMLAWVTVRHVVPSVDRLSAGLLAVSSIAVLAPMFLAVQWAVGVTFGTPALSIPDMVRFHGITNAVGFTLLGVLGWRRLSAQAFNRA